MPWAALNHPPPRLPGPAQTQSLMLSGCILVSRLKRSPEELRVQKQLPDEEGNATSKKRDMRPRETPLQIFMGSTPKHGLCCCKGSNQVQTHLTPVGIHEPSPHSQVMQLTPQPGNGPPGYNHPRRGAGSSQGNICPSAHSNLLVVRG